MNVRNHNATLDGLRGIAAVAVVWLHLTAASGIGSFPNRAYLAVDFFFVLSGFVVADAYERRLLSTLPLLGFVRIRVIRLYPLIVLALMFGFFIKTGSLYHYGSRYTGASGYGQVFEFFLFGVLLIPCPASPDAVFPLDGPLWSLMFEMWTNVFYAASIRVLRTSAAFALLGLSALGLFWGSYTYGSLDLGFSMSTLWVGLMRVLFSFFFGVLIYRLFESGRFSKIPKISTWIPTAVVILSFFPAPTSFGWLYDLFIVILVYPSIIIFCTADAIPSSIVPFALMAGRLSYPLYVLHRSVFGNLFYLSRLHGVRLALALFAMSFLMILTSYVVMRLYDEPVRKFLGTIHARKTQRV